MTEVFPKGKRMNVHKVLLEKNNKHETDVQLGWRPLKESSRVEPGNILLFSKSSCPSEVQLPRTQSRNYLKMEGQDMTGLLV